MGHLCFYFKETKSLKCDFSTSVLRGKPSGMPEKSLFLCACFTGGLVDCEPSIGKIMVRKPTRAVGEHATGLLTGGGRFSLTAVSFSKLE